VVQRFGRDAAFRQKGLNRIRRFDRWKGR
jgi:hypothetical protein